MFSGVDFDLLDRLNCELSKYVIKIDSNTITNDELDVAKKIFYEYVFGMTNMDLFSMYMLMSVKNRRRCSSLKKKRGDYSIPDKVIDGVISAIIAGENVDVACKFAGITKSTLYNRIKSRGYTDVKSFFKNRRLN